MGDDRKQNSTLANDARSRASVVNEGRGGCCGLVVMGCR